MRPLLNGFNGGLSRFFQSPLNIRLAQILPYQFFRIYIHAMGFCYYLVQRDERCQITESFSQILGDGPCGIKLGLLKFKTFLGIFDHYFEKLVNAHGPFDKTIRFVKNALEIENRSLLDEFSRNGRGSLLITGHFGAVEYLPLALVVNGYKPAIVVRFKSQKLKKASMRRGAKMDVHLIDADQPDVLKKMLQALQDGRTLVTLCDEFKHWKPCRNRPISVMGQKVPTDSTLDILHRRTRSPACLGLMRRTRKKLFLHIDPITDGRRPLSLSGRAWPMLERYIRRYPEQWYQWKDVAEGLATYRLKE